jgi:macrolide transport system ATP-binding/permease protein
VTSSCSHSVEKLIRIASVSKTYRLGEIEVEALRGVTFDIEPGEFVAVMGASGSGKSTLMNIIGCLDRPTSGTYLLEGVDVGLLGDEELAAIRSRSIGFVFQSFNLLARTTALENVELPLFYSGWPSDGEERARQLLELLGLADREQNHPTQLSGGQQQRVAIARALINDPAILLADEPTGNLDSTTSVEILKIIRKLNRERGLTVVVVTHDPDTAAYADRTITFRDGVIVSDERAPGEDRTTLPTHLGPLSARQPSDQIKGKGPHRAASSENPWMFGAMALSAAARALHRNKLRAALTMLGIFIGVAAVIAMIAVGNGARYSVQQQINSLGTNLLVIMPGATTSNGVRAGLGSTSTLTIKDADAIAKDINGVAAVSYLDRQIAQVVYGHRNWSTGISGVTPAYLVIRDWSLAAGRAFSEDEAQNAAPVCLLGQTVVTNLFAEGENPIGSTIRVRNFPLRVVGVLTAKGQSSFGQDQDDLILMPFYTAQRKVLGSSQVTATVSSVTGNGSTNPVQNPYAGVPTTNAVYATASALLNPFGNAPQVAGVVNQIFVKVADTEAVEQVQSEVQNLLERQHHIRSGEDDDFTVRSLNEIAQASENASRVMTLLLAAVASISLLVGGIGIMNIMLVSVTERTREIGIRMAIGARKRHILLQFLTEALLLSAVGGVSGIVLGIGSAQALSALAKWPTLVSPGSVVGGFAFAAAVGVFFGWYPARKASLLDPIEALRYE